MRVRLTGLTSVVLCAAALNAASAAPVYSYIDEKGPGSLGVVLEDHREGGILCGVKGWYRLSTDEGRTWKKLYPYKRGAGRHLLRLRDGRLLGIVPEIVENIVGNKLKAANYYAYFSSDEGRSWQGRVPISTENRRLYLMNDRIIRLSTGRILVPFSLHPNELLDKQAESVGWVNAFYSDDEGATWREGKRRPTSAADQMCEPNAIERDDGTLVMLARTGKGYLYRCDSTDGGETWSEERPTTLRSPLAPFHMSKDPYTGWVFIAWHNSFPGPVVQCPRSPLSLAVSRDGCDSWEFICDIENDSMSSYGYPAFHFTRDSVIVAYYETLGHRKFVKEEQHAKVAVFKRSELTVDRVVKEPLTPSAATVRRAPPDRFDHLFLHILAFQLSERGAAVFDGDDRCRGMVAVSRLRHRRPRRRSAFRLADPPGMMFAPRGFLRSVDVGVDSSVPAACRRPPSCGRGCFRERPGDVSSSRSRVCR